MLEQLVRDVRYSFRTLLRSPGFTLVSIVCLALGIGASTTIFSVVNAVLFKPLPFRDSDRLVRVYTEFPTFPGGGLPKFPASAPEFRELQREGRAWDQLEAWSTGGANLNGNAEPVRINAALVSGGLMGMLGVQPIRGRVVSIADDSEGAPRTVVLSHGLWRRAFPEDPAVIGWQTYLDGGKATIIGIMPEGFEFPAGATEPAEAWIPLQLSAQQMTRRGGHFLSLVAHLRPGLLMERARLEVGQLIEHFGEKSSNNFHAINRKFHPIVIHGFQQEVAGNAKKPMLMLLGAVGFFLLIACVNVANLLLARSEARQKEVALREAIGAGKLQLMRQFIVEGTVLASAGAAAGLLLASAGVTLIRETNAGMIPRIREAAVDGNVLLFAVAVSLLTRHRFRAGAADPSSYRLSTECVEIGRAHAGSILIEALPGSSRIGGSRHGFGASDRRRAARARVLGTAKRRAWLQRDTAADSPLIPAAGDLSTGAKKAILVRCG